MTTTEADRRAYHNIINAPDPVAGIELVAAHREAGERQGLERAAQAIDHIVIAGADFTLGRIAAALRALRRPLMPEITDADREAAVHFLEYYNIHGWEKSVGNIRDGKADGSESVRAFAAHRKTAYQAGLLAGAKAMQWHAICAVPFRSEAYIALVRLDPEQITRDTSLDGEY